MDPITLIFILGGGLLFATSRKKKTRGSGLSLEPPLPVPNPEPVSEPPADEDEVIEEREWETSSNSDLPAPVVGTVVKTAAADEYPYAVSFRYKNGIRTYYVSNLAMAKALNSGYVVHPPEVHCADAVFSKLWSAWVCEGEVYPGDVVAYGIYDNGTGFTEYRVVVAQDKNVPFVGQVKINGQWHTKASYVTLMLAIANMKKIK